MHTVHSTDISNCLLSNYRPKKEYGMSNPFHIAIHRDGGTGKAARHVPYLKSEAYLKFFEKTCTLKGRKTVCLT